MLRLAYHWLILHQSMLVLLDDKLGNVLISYPTIRCLLIVDYLLHPLFLDSCEGNLHAGRLILLLLLVGSAFVKIYSLVRNVVLYIRERGRVVLIGELRFALWGLLIEDLPVDGNAFIFAIVQVECFMD